MGDWAMANQDVKIHHKPFLRLSVLCLAALGLIQFGGVSAENVLPGVSPQTGVVAGNNQFAWELYQKIKGTPENKGMNIVFSPYSMATALAMTYAGSRGNTEKQMAQVLHFTLSQQALHQVFAALNKQITSPDTKLYRLNCANALWGQRDYHFETDFTTLVKQYYNGGMQTVDYAAQPQTAVNTINRWVERQTASKIKNLLTRDDIGSLTRLILTNAIYFKGNWESQFKPEMTKPAPFVTAAAKVTAPMMRQKGKFRYAEDAGTQILELPYAGKDLAMLLVLPKGNFNQFEADLTAERIRSWRGQLTEQKVEVIIPKFKFATRYYLDQLLPQLGMSDAFSDTKADFSGITGKRDLHIDHVIHQAVIDVNEEGSEAAAATTVVMNLKSVSLTPVFRADHPFIFVIVHQPTGSVLFLGRVADPTQG
jgi:serpin B